MVSTRTLLLKHYYRRQDIDEKNSKSFERDDFYLIATFFHGVSTFQPSGREAPGLNFLDVSGGLGPKAQMTPLRLGGP